MQWEVIIGHGTGDFGPFRANYQSSHVVEADTLEEALNLGCQRAREKGWDKIVTQRAVRRYRWAITLRGRKDKRRRETFFVHATSEDDAIKFLNYKDKARHFAGYFTPQKRDAVVSVERLED